jgi:hypothetical protein
MLKYIEKQTCTSTQRRRSLDFGLTPASSVELEENEFGLDVSKAKAYAAQRVFFCPQGRGLYQIFFNPKSKIPGQSTIKNSTKACVICFFNF